MAEFLWNNLGICDGETDGERSKLRRVHEKGAEVRISGGCGGSGSTYSTPKKPLQMRSETMNPGEPGVLHSIGVHRISTLCIMIGEEEVVDLGKEKFEWASGEESTPPPTGVRKLRRLRRMSDIATVKKPPPAVDEENEAGHSSEDEDWKKDATAEDDSEEVELDDEDDEDEHEEIVVVKSRKGKSRASLSMSGSAPPTLGSGLTSASGSTVSKKRKKVDVGSLGCAKKFSFDAINTTAKVESEAPMSCDRREQSAAKVPTALTGEVAERFGQRDAERFKFLGEGRKDAKGRCPGNPDYDPRTFYCLPSS